ncbi:hypothetical protein [Cerasicoccus frondis]|uniref:hypothetical protein n=1 Tax=Cerasicoccus frondis TaxID=490090 RepID=UPI0028528AB1|nr:hypothetical protein [Cerasicoccus frondis]
MSGNANSSAQKRGLNPVQPKRDFKETQPDREKEYKRDLSKEQLVTKQQLQALEAQRDQRKQPKLTHEMKGPLGQSVRDETDRELEKKIAAIKTKLNSKKVQKRFNRSR